MKDKTKKKERESQKEDEKKEVLTKEDFLKALKKATRPISQKSSRGKG